MNLTLTKEIPCIKAYYFDCLYRGIIIWKVYPDSGFDHSSDILYYNYPLELKRLK